MNLILFNNDTFTQIIIERWNHIFISIYVAPEGFVLPVMKTYFSFVDSITLTLLTFSILGSHDLYPGFRIVLSCSPILSWLQGYFRAADVMFISAAVSMATDRLLCLVFWIWRGSLADLATRQTPNICGTTREWVKPWFT